MEAVRTSETSVDNHSTRQYNPEDSSEHHTRRRENLKSHRVIFQFLYFMKNLQDSFETDAENVFHLLADKHPPVPVRHCEVLTTVCSVSGSVLATVCSVLPSVPPSFVHYLNELFENSSQK